ncbi:MULTISPECIES: glycine zipper domain-containing protein [Legionella]|uniref:Glycine zipper domain-containing protein n=1 Tax=Legionella maceachernii TaxID=466 RepID=A0A0W0WG43_9GAMM|nr:glycine zipper domain-containing protein [Legionella maceachernii]KTD31298.1 hypothetical protein Lmac_0352 [Legionella maceachernii]SKA00218.1 Glycine zipper [Legionella maceachernii]SUP01319.1 Surface antigen [Legionella maceachernii]
MKKTIAYFAFAGLSALTLCSCTNTQVGTVAGGAAGAGIGYAVGRGGGAVVGGGLGALVGNQIGQAQDRRYWRNAAWGNGYWRNGVYYYY